MDGPASILWTSMPVDLVVDGLTPAAAATMEMSVGGRILQVLPGENGKGTVQRLISGDPQDYLDPRWQPGAAISLREP
jgi:hypothetical protein